MIKANRKVMQVTERQSSAEDVKVAGPVAVSARRIVLIADNHSLDDDGNVFLSPPEDDRVAGVTRVIETGGFRIGSAPCVGILDDHRAARRRRRAIRAA